LRFTFFLYNITILNRCNDKRTKYRPVQIDCMKTTGKGYVEILIYDKTERDVFKGFSRVPTCSPTLPGLS
jgi:hypothetical protein